MKVTARPEKNSGVLLNATITNEQRNTSTGAIPNQILRVTKTDVSEVLLEGLQANNGVSFSINGNDFVDFYYWGSDDQAYIFQTVP